MLLKRKRSESEFSCSSSSTFNSPPRPDGFFPHFLTSPTPSRCGPAPAHLNSRTMKRFRDNRPSEDEVHQHTLQLLYSAQKPQIRPFRPQLDQAQSLQHHTSAFTNPLAQEQHRPSAAQASLHNFWRLPGQSRPMTGSIVSLAPPPSSVLEPSVYGSKSCEDCGQDVVEYGQDADAMDVDEWSAGSQTSCVGCGKNVCSHCSITKLGEQRRCLTCAGTR